MAWFFAFVFDICFWLRINRNHTTGAPTTKGPILKPNTHSCFDLCTLCKFCNSWLISDNGNVLNADSNKCHPAVQHGKLKMSGAKQIQLTSKMYQIS